MRDRLMKKIAFNLYICNECDCADCEYRDIEYDKCKAMFLADSILEDGWIRPPCKVGDTIYYLHITCDSDGKEYGEIVSGEVVSLSIDNRNKWVYARYNGGLTMWHLFEDFGFTLFLTKEEAEQKLKEMGDK